MHARWFYIPSSGFWFYDAHKVHLSIPGVTPADQMACTVKFNFGYAQGKRARCEVVELLSSLALSKAPSCTHAGMSVPSAK
jgi:hypothetical protein